MANNRCLCNVECVMCKENFALHITLYTLNKH